MTFNKARKLSKILTSTLYLSFSLARASGVLANLSVRSEQGACVTHDAGRLVVDSCLLQSTPAPGLEHLFTPLVTNANSPGAPPPRKRRRTDAGLGGVLSVRETKIRVRPQCSFAVLCLC